LRLIVAHHILIVQNADAILLVVKDGHVIEKGSLKELIVKPDGTNTNLLFSK
jgi:ABC-type transport system involved in Fe-S cluster assembly fused permease/ATPase subunit